MGRTASPVGAAEDVGSGLRCVRESLCRPYGTRADFPPCYVRKMLADIVKDQDLSRYIL